MVKRRTEATRFDGEGFLDIEGLSVTDAIPAGTPLREPDPPASEAPPWREGSEGVEPVRLLAGLSGRAAQWVLEYLKDYNGAAAAERVGYSKARAHSAARKFLQDRRVLAAVRQEEEGKWERTRVEVDDIVEEYDAIARSNIRHYAFNERGELVLREHAPKRAVRAVGRAKCRITTAPGGKQFIEWEIALWDKMDALKHLGRHLGMFRDEKAVEAAPAAPPVQLLGLSDEELATFEALLAKAVQAPVNPGRPRNAHGDGSSPEWVHEGAVPLPHRPIPPPSTWGQGWVPAGQPDPGRADPECGTVREG